MDINLKYKTGMKGRFKMNVVDPKTNEIKRSTGWFDNLITDGGLNMKGTLAPARACHVGSGSTTPSVTDTQLDTFVASTSNRISTPRGSQTDVIPRYAWQQVLFRFGAGQAEGNLTEVGITNDDFMTASGPLFSRALILDGSGNPTTLSILSDEILEVWYELRHYIPTDDLVENIEINGVMTEVRTRAARITDSSQYGWAGSTTIFGRPADFVTGQFSNSTAVWSGDIGTQFDNSPSGSLANENSASLPSYVDGSLTRTAEGFWNIDNANFETGIRSVQFRSYIGTYQSQFDPPIQKDNTQELRINVEVSWGRFNI